MRVSILPATWQDALELEVRPEDVQEFYASSGQTPEQVLHNGFARSPEVMAGRVDGALVCIFGVCPLGLFSGKWAPWLVASPAMYEHKREFIQYCKPVLDAMLARYNPLQNWVDARNTAAIRWLRWLGFTIHDPEPFGYQGLPFHKFTMEKNNV